jgi:hypothetical protein
MSLAQGCLLIINLTGLFKLRREVVFAKEVPVVALNLSEQKNL